MAPKTIDEYIASLGGDWRAEAVADMRRVVDGAAPEATASIKWAQPVWQSNGPFAYIKAFSRSVNIGFWRGAELDDPKGLLEFLGAARALPEAMKAGDTAKAEAIKT